MKAQEYLELYCKRLEIESPPRMILQMKEYRHWVRVVLGKPRMPNIASVLGRCHTGKNTIWINAIRHRNKVRLRHTIAHELIHVKYPSIPHGNRFDNLVMSVISDTLANQKIRSKPIEVRALPVVVNPTRCCKLCNGHFSRLKYHLKKSHPRIKYERFSASTLDQYYS